MSSSAMDLSKAWYSIVAFKQSNFTKLHFCDNFRQFLPIVTPEYSSQ